MSRITYDKRSYQQTKPFHLLLLKIKLTIFLTIIIFGPRVLLMVKMCNKRTQKMTKFKLKMIRPTVKALGFQSVGTNLKKESNG